MFVATFCATASLTTPGVVRVDALRVDRAAVSDAADSPSAFGAVALLGLLCGVRVEVFAVIERRATPAFDARGVR